MSMTDPIADLLTRIRNAQTARKTEVSMSSSKVKTAIVRVLKDEGYVEDFRIGNDGGKSTLTIGLKYYEGKPVIDRLERVSRPGLAWPPWVPSRVPRWRLRRRDAVLVGSVPAAGVCASAGGHRGAPGVHRAAEAGLLVLLPERRRLLPGRSVLPRVLGAGAAERRLGLKTAGARPARAHRRASAGARRRAPGGARPRAPRERLARGARRDGRTRGSHRAAR